MVLAFASINKVEDFLVGDDSRTLAASEAACTNAARSEYWASLRYRAINHLLPKLATHQ